MNDPLRAVDVLDLEPDHFAGAQSTAVAEAEQQARPQAIGNGQYVSALSRWTYGDLQRQVSAALGKRGNVPFELVRSQSGAAVTEPEFVDAATAAVVRLYPKAVLMAELQRDPKQAQAFAAMLAREIMALRTRLERRNIHSARDRVRHFLSLNVGADGHTVDLPGTLKELAADLGLTHESLYRTLARMQADGEIKRTGPTIRIGQPM